MESTRTFDPRIEALVSYSTRHLTCLTNDWWQCESVFGLHTSEGTIAAALARVDVRADTDVAQIDMTVRGRPVINSDETGVRVDRWRW